MRFVCIAVGRESLPRLDWLVSLSAHGGAACSRTVVCMHYADCIDTLSGKAARDAWIRDLERQLHGRDSEESRFSSAEFRTARMP